MIIPKPVEMIEEVRQGVRAKGEHTPMPEISQILEAIRRMDGASRSLISLNMADGSTVMIGGANGAYIFTMETNDHIVNMISGDEDDVFIPLVVGGQESDYPSHYVTGYDNVAELLSSSLTEQQVPKKFKFEVISKD